MYGKFHLSKRHEHCKAVCWPLFRLHSSDMRNRATRFCTGMSREEDSLRRDGRCTSPNHHFWSSLVTLACSMTHREFGYIQQNGILRDKTLLCEIKLYQVSKSMWSHFCSLLSSMNIALFFIPWHPCPNLNAPLPGLHNRSLPLTVSIQMLSG